MKETDTQPVPVMEDIQRARTLIAPYLHRTPLLTCSQLDERAGARVFLKCENFQKVGAFKFRGASNAIFSMTDGQGSKGVATHSSGNHAQAVALAARMKGIPAHIVMPENAPGVKRRAVEGYGAEITLCEPTQKGRETALEQVVERTGAAFIHPYNDPRIIAGQGTAAMEMLEDAPPLDLILAPVGGGGLISGTAIAAAGMAPSVRVIGCEPELADDAFRSFRDGRLQPADNPDTIADGLRTSLGELPFACMQRHLHDMVTVTEEEIREAMRYVWERMKIIIEPSSAVPVAALLNGSLETEGRTVGVIISGGNVDLDHLPW